MITLQKNDGIYKDSKNKEISTMRNDHASPFSLEWGLKEQEWI
jgi:hypothetical protein